MNSSKGRRRDANAVVRSVSQNTPELQVLIEAQAALDHARQHAKWKRECKNLQSASHAVQAAALAAHEAGIGWTEIGDVLGIERAMPQPTTAAVEPLPTPQPHVVDDFDGGRHRNHDVVAATLRHFPETRQWVPRPSPA